MFQSLGRNKVLSPTAGAVEYQSHGYTLKLLGRLIASSSPKGKQEITGVPPFFWKERGGAFRSQTMSETPSKVSDEL
jgi:hypothetical protein